MPQKALKKWKKDERIEFLDINISNNIRVKSDPPIYVPKQACQQKTQLLKEKPHHYEAGNQICKHLILLSCIHSTKTSRKAYICNKWPQFCQLFVQPFHLQVCVKQDETNVTLTVLLS